MTESTLATPLPAGTAAGTRPRRWAWWLLGLALLVDLLVCVPFLLDPLELRQAGGAWLGAATPAGPTDYLVFLAPGTTRAQLEGFAASHPGVTLAHRGDWLDTAVLTLAAGNRERLAALKAQPWARLVTPNGAVFCR